MMTYVKQIGVKIIVDCQMDLTTATTHTLQVLRPDGSLITWVAAVSGTTLQYTTISGDLTVPGRYAIQPYVVLTSNGFNGRGQTVFLDVFGFFDRD